MRNTRHAVAAASKSKWKKATISNWYNFADNFMTIWSAHMHGHVHSYFYMANNNHTNVSIILYAWNCIGYVSVSVWFGLVLLNCSLFLFQQVVKYTFFMMAFFGLCSFNSGIFACKRNYYFRFALCAILWNVIRRINTLTYPMSAHARNVVTCKFDSCFSYFGRWIYVR